MRKGGHTAAFSTVLIFRFNLSLVPDAVRLLTSFPALLGIGERNLLSKTIQAENRLYWRSLLVALSTLQSDYPLEFSYFPLTTAGYFFDSAFGRQQGIGCDLAGNYPHGSTNFVKKSIHLQLSAEFHDAPP